MNTIVIPARRGSKRILNKNMVSLNGYPLILWTLMAAKNSNASRVVVTTDSDEVEQYCTGLGFQVIRRPEELAADNVHAAEAVVHACKHLELNPMELVMMLLPTSPLRITADINTAFNLLQQCPTNASVIGVTPVANELNIRLLDRGILHRILPKRQVTKHGEVREVYRVNGAIFTTRWQTLQEEGEFHVPLSYPYVMPPERSVDIDLPKDLALARSLL